MYKTNSKTKNLKNLFPIFQKYPNLIFLDNASTTQKPQILIDSLTKYYTEFNANVHRGLYKLSEQSTSMYEESRYKVAKFINSEPEEVVFCSGTTEAMNLVTNMLIKSNLVSKDSYILTSILEHHSSFLPWQQQCENIVFLNLDKDFNIDTNSVPQKKYDIIVLTLTSNVTGSVINLKDIKNKYADKNTIIIVDAAQYIANAKINVKDLDADFLAFSAHKIFGPTGLGVLYINKRLHEKLEPFKVGGGIVEEVYEKYSTFTKAPNRYEAGTPPIAEVIAFGEVIDFIQMYQLISDKSDLRRYLVTKLKEMPEVEVYHPNLDIYAHPVVSFNLKGIHSHDVAQFLGDQNICVRAGHHCAQLLHRSVFQVNSTVRISLSVYNSEEDMDMLVNSLKKCFKFFERNKTNQT